MVACHNTNPVTLLVRGKRSIEVQFNDAGGGGVQVEAKVGTYLTVGGSWASRYDLR